MKNLLFTIVIFAINICLLLGQSNELSETISKGHYQKAAELAKDTRWYAINSGQLNWSPLYFAIFQAGIDSITYLKVYAKSKEKVLSGYSLHKSSFLNLCKQLIDSGIKLNQFDKKGRSPLYYACVFRLADLVEYMIYRKSPIEDSEDLFRLAASLGYRAIVQQMLKYKLNPCDAGRECFAPIHLAAMNGHADILEDMILSKANTECLTTQGFAEFSGLSPIQIAAMNGHAGAFEILLKAGANPRIQNSTGENLLHLASKGTRILEFKRNKKGDATDFLMIRGGNYLLAKNIDSLLPGNFITDSSGITPLHWAAYYRNVELCLYFLSKNHPPSDVHHDASHIFASALTHSLYHFRSGVIPIRTELLKLSDRWREAENQYSDSLQRIQSKIVGRKLLQAGFIALATAAAHYQASIDASSTGFGYSSVEYPLIETGDLQSIKKHINRQILICQELSSYMRSLNDSIMSAEVLLKINKTINHE